jgi:hypothetical protein
MVVQRGLIAYARRRLPGDVPAVPAAVPPTPPVAPEAAPAPAPETTAAETPAVEPSLDVPAVSVPTTEPVNESVKMDVTEPMTPSDVQKQRVLYFQQKAQESTSTTASASEVSNTTSPVPTETNLQSIQPTADTVKVPDTVEKLEQADTSAAPKGFHPHLYENANATVFDHSGSSPHALLESKGDPVTLPSFFIVTRGNVAHSSVEPGALNTPATAASSATAASNNLTHLAVFKESSTGSDIVRYIKKVYFFIFYFEGPVRKMKKRFCFR